MSRGRRKPKPFYCVEVSRRIVPSTEADFEAFWGRFDRRLLEHFGLDENFQPKPQAHASHTALLERLADGPPSPAGGVPLFPRSLPDPDEPGTEDMVAQPRAVVTAGEKKWGE